MDRRVYKLSDCLKRPNCDRGYDCEAGNIVNEEREVISICPYYKKIYLNSFQIVSMFELSQDEPESLQGSLIKLVEGQHSFVFPTSNQH